MRIIPLTILLDVATLVEWADENITGATGIQLRSESMSNEVQPEPKPHDDLMRMALNRKERGGEWSKRVPTEQHCVLTDRVRHKISERFGEPKSVELLAGQFHVQWRVAGAMAYVVVVNARDVRMTLYRLIGPNDPQGTKAGATERWDVSVSEHYDRVATDVLNAVDAGIARLTNRGGPNGLRKS